MREHDAGAARPGAHCSLDYRALAIWPRLDRRALRRCGCDPVRIADLVSRRTSLSREAILELLVTPAVSEAEAQYWFG